MSKIGAEVMVLFYGGPFSQWYPSVFEIDRSLYNCAEQYMMAEKARMFRDHHSLAAVLCSQSPAEQKAIGRRVRGFDKSRWEQHAQEIVYRGNLAKFQQNIDLRNVLLETGTATIVEASPTDRIWGIGLSTTDPRALDRKKWWGTNWLGEAIMRVREELNN